MAYEHGLREGDEVELVYTYRGKVESIVDTLGRVKQDGTHVRLANAGGMYPLKEAKLTVTKKAPPKVGDVIAGADVDRLPLGAVILHSPDNGHSYGVNVWQRTTSGWLSTMSAIFPRPVPSLNYKVLHIPSGR